MFLLIAATLFTLLVLMVAVRRSAAGSAPETPGLHAGRLRGDGCFSLEVVGESHYQPALEKICGGKTEDGVEKYVEAVLHLENANPHDSLAVRVDVSGLVVGYLSRKEARAFRTGLADLGQPSMIGVCDAVIRGGWMRKNGDTGNFGIWLDLPMN